MTQRLTAREIVTDALSLIGRYTPNDTAPEGHDVLRGLDWLDKALAMLMAERWVTQLTAPMVVTVPFKAGVDTYELSKMPHFKDGIAFPLSCSIVVNNAREPFRLVRLDEWDELRDRSGVEGLPQFGHLDRTDAQRLRVWPKPTEATGHLELSVCSYPPTVAASPNRASDKTGNVSIGLRPEWSLWAAYQLAYHLGNGPVIKLPNSERAELLTMAEKYKGDLEAFVAQEMPVQPPISHPYDPYGSPALLHWPRY